MFRGWLAIPYIRQYPNPNRPNLGRSVVSIRFRCIQDHDHHGHGKYMTVAGDKPRLYNTVSMQTHSPFIAITEGEIDTITAQLCGIPSVGVPGTQAWQPHFKELFLGYRDVFILQDGDQPGRDFAETLAKQLPNSKIIPCPPGEDVNSLVYQHGSQALTNRLK